MNKRPSHYVWPAALLDADFAIKLGRIQKYRIIEKVLPNLIGNLVIHEYVYHNEILLPKDAREQIDILIEHKRASIVSEKTLSPSASLLYEHIVEKLRKAKGTRERGSHWGEIVSVAYGQSANISYFLSDEADLQAFIHQHFTSPLQVIRIEQLVMSMKEAGFRRKDALLIWIIAGYRKERFHHELWPHE